METMRKPTAPRILQEIAVSIKTKKKLTCQCVFSQSVIENIMLSEYTHWLVVKDLNMKSVSWRWTAVLDICKSLSLCRGGTTKPQLPIGTLRPSFPFSYPLFLHSLPSLPSFPLLFPVSLLSPATRSGGALWASQLSRGRSPGVGAEPGVGGGALTANAIWRIFWSKNASAISKMVMVS